MSVTTSNSSGRIYLAGQLDVLTGPSAVPLDLSGFGSNICGEIKNVNALSANASVGIQVQFPMPAPKCYLLFATGVTGDVKTPTGVDVGLQVTPTGSWFQPTDTGVYDILFTTTAALAANSNLCYIQPVAQNTVGQYIDEGSIQVFGGQPLDPSLSVKDFAERVQVKELVNLNTPSAIPNAIKIDVYDLPLPCGIPLNAFAFNVKLDAMANITSGNPGSAFNNSQPLNVRLSAGQMFVHPWQIEGAVGTYARFTGSFIITVTGAGTTYVPNTFLITSVAGTPSTFANLDFIRTMNITTSNTSRAIPSVSYDKNSDNSSAVVEKVNALSDMLSRHMEKDAVRYKIIDDLCNLMRTRNNILG